MTRNTTSTSPPPQLPPRYTHQLCTVILLTENTMANSSEEKRVQFINQRLETLLTEKAALYEKIDQHVKMVMVNTFVQHYFSLCTLYDGLIY